MAGDEEKRQFLRVDDQISIDYRIITLGDKPHGNLRFSGLADMDNISEGGILFEYHESIPAESLMELAFNVGKPAPLFMKGRVKHVKQLGVKRYAIGIQFLENVKEDKRDLLDYIKKKNSQRIKKNI